MTYYNEHDRFAAAWLRELINGGHVAPGVVDERSITDVRPADLAGYRQCHFFAGIGGWSYALRLAGWPDDRPVWTGSCPCQPFSSAGKGDGADDPRHLWPAWFRLIRECRPQSIFGEQVASSDGLAWFDRVSTDLEGTGYAVGAVDLGAASVGAPHIRQRLWFVADDDENGRGGVATSRLHDNARRDHANGRGEIGDVGDSSGAGLQGAEQSPTRRRNGHGSEASRSARQPGRPFWTDCDWLPCRDGKARPIEPGSFPLAHGVSARVGRLRGYGNAIVPQVAAEVIRAYMDIGGDA